MYKQGCLPMNFRPSMEVTLMQPQAWSSGSTTIGNYYQINLGSITAIAGVVLQGRANSDQWVTTFTVEYSYD
eukprot:Awhi_evm1s11804